MSGGTVIAGSLTVGGLAGGLGTAAGLASQADNLLGGGGSSGGGGGGSGGGGQSIQSQQYSYYGPHPSTSPMGGSQEPEPQKTNPLMPLNQKVGKAAVATGNEADRRTSTEAQPENVPAKFQDIWANRLSRYLDYNTRGLG